MIPMMPEARTTTAATIAAIRPARRWGRGVGTGSTGLPVGSEIRHPGVRAVQKGMG